MRLIGHHALITGGGTGIGAAIARSLAAQGARVSLVGRRREPLETVAAELGDGCEIACADVTSRAEVDAAFAQVRDANGPLTILVNNAGAAESQRFTNVSDEAWRRILAVNLDALLYCSQAALPDLLNAEAGRLVTIASTAGLKGYAYIAPYVAAKHGAVGLMRALALEYAATKMTANAVCPGFVETDMLTETIARIKAKTGRSEEEARAELARFNPQGRIVTAEQVAAAVLWLCLPESGAITGQAVAVAGGEVM